VSTKIDEGQGRCINLLITDPKHMPLPAEVLV